MSEIKREANTIEFDGVKVYCNTVDNKLTAVFLMPGSKEPHLMDAADAIDFAIELIRMIVGTNLDNNLKRIWYEYHWYERHVKE